MSELNYRHESAFKGKCEVSGFLNCLTLEDGIDRLSRNIGTLLPSYTAYHIRREKASAEGYLIIF